MNANETKTKHSIQTKVTLTRQNLIDTAMEIAGLNGNDIEVINEPAPVMVLFGGGELIEVEEKSKGAK